MTILANGSAPLIRTARLDAMSLAAAPVINIGSIEFRMGDVAPGERLGASARS